MNTSLMILDNSIFYLSIWVCVGVINIKIMKNNNIYLKIIFYVWYEFDKFLFVGHA